MELTFFEDPPRIPVQPTNSEARYIVGDASGSGFGSSSWIAGEEKIGATYGAWKKAVTNHMSSNFCETANLVISLREKVKEGSIKRGLEVFVFPDNSTAEATMYKGSSKSPLLHQMVLDLKKMEMVGDIIVHFVWMSGCLDVWEENDSTRN